MRKWLFSATAFVGEIEGKGRPFVGLALYLDTSEMEDGVYEIHARGTDINGVVGKEATVEFHLDTAKPRIEFTSHVSGELVNGRITLTGAVMDRNGVKLLEYRPEDQEEYRSIRFTGEKDAQNVQFQLRINSQELPDGPQIYWFRGTDRTGSIGQSAFLFFVDMFGAKGPFYHFAHSYPHVVYTWLVMAILIGLGFLATKTIAIVPGPLQNLFELVVSGIENFMVDNTGEEGRWLFPVAASIFIFVFISNLIGLVPGCYPPTATLNTTGALALVVFVLTHIIGIKYHGKDYYKHFIGPVWWMVPLILPIEIIGHLARVLSLSFRLFGNMMGHELVIGILFMLAGLFFAPLPIMAMGIFVAFVQAFVFFLLSIIYFSSAMEHAGYSPRLVQGREDNIKITRPADLLLAELYLKSLSEKPGTGNSI